MKKSPIVVSLSVLSQIDKEPLGFEIHDEGVKFHGKYTEDDLVISYAVLMDLADAIQLKIKNGKH